MKESIYFLWNSIFSSFLFAPSISNLLSTLTLVANISKVTMNFSSGKKCLIAQIKLYKIRPTCKQQDGTPYGIQF